MARRAVIIGGSSGIGFATAKLLFDEGWEVVIAARNPERLAAAHERIGAGVEARPVDMMDQNSVRRFVEAVGPFDDLVIPGSSAVVGNFLETPMEDVQRYYDSKFWGTYRIVREAHRNLRPGGTITLFSGAAGQKASPGFAFGSALNAAMERLSDSLAIELAPLRVNTICPGIIDTPVWSEMVADEVKQAIFADMAARLPTKRVGTPGEVADAVLFVIRNAYVTGTVIRVDGGYVHV
jgi:NAD(P)-dependent dehydrogenase (short-subunit alcohol dehydrogenase family)